MEKTKSKSSHGYGSGDERDDRGDDEQPTTSKGNSLTFNLEQTAHNMHDMNAMDFNSADEVRQAMKAILAGKLPPPPFSEEAKYYNPEIMKPFNEIVQKNTEHVAQDVHKTVQHKAQRNLYQKMKNANNNPNNGGSTKRPGRQPKAGPSKQLTKHKISSMYLGKLSNVVSFRRGNLSDCESDVILFY